MNPAEMEQVYEALAQRIDSVDAASTDIFLAKLALMMAQRIGDVAAVLACIEAAAASLPTAGDA